MLISYSTKHFKNEDVAFHFHNFEYSNYMTHGHECTLAHLNTTDIVTTCYPVRSDVTKFEGNPELRNLVLITEFHFYK